MASGKIYLDEDGLNQCQEEIKELEKQIRQIEKDLTEAYNNAPGDGAHDNGAFEDLLMQRRMRQGEVQRRKESLKKAEIVNKGTNVELIEIGDVVRLNLIFTNDEPENLIVKLIGGIGKGNNEVIQEVSLNSPLGSAIYHRKVPDETSYPLNGDTVQVEILERIIETNLERVNNELVLE